MKKLLIALLIIGTGVNTFAQDVIFEAKLQKENVPAFVINAVEEDFPDFVLEEFSAIPVKYVEQDVIINKHFNNSDKDYDTYVITLKGKGRAITATYDKSGKLLSTVELTKNEKLPKVVALSVGKTYPGWSIYKDSYKMVHYTGHKEKERYNLTLEKGMEKLKVFTDANGKILKHTRAHRMMGKKQKK